MKTIVMLTVASPLYTPSILKVMLKVCDATWCNRAPNQIKETTLIICTTISTLVPLVSPSSGEGKTRDPKNEVLQLVMRSTFTAVQITSR